MGQLECSLGRPAAGRLPAGAPGTRAPAAVKQWPWRGLGPLNRPAIQAVWRVVLAHRSPTRTACLCAAAATAAGLTRRGCALPRPGLPPCCPAPPNVAPRPDPTSHRWARPLPDPPPTAPTLLSPGGARRLPACPALPCPPAEIPADKKVAIYKVVRGIANIAVNQVKDFTATMPKVLKEGLSKEEAEAAKTQLVEAGAKAKVV